MSIPKFRKIYFPGLISLVFLPVMCICFLISHNAFPKYQAMPTAWTTKEQLNKWIHPYDKKHNVDNFRKYELINLTGDLKNDATAQEKLKKLLVELPAKNDTINGIKVIFG